MKIQRVFSIACDDISLSILATSPKHAAKLARPVLVETGLIEAFEEEGLEFFPDDPEECELGGQTVMKFWESQGIAEMIPDTVIITVWNDVERFARVIDLKNPELTMWNG